MKKKNKNGIHGEALASQLPALIPWVTPLVTAGTTADLRRAAVGLLRCIVVTLPYSEVHNYRESVTETLEKGLDDRKRAVRKEAARALDAWRQ